MKTKLFILIAAIAALTMAGCAASGEEGLSPPADDGIAGGETVPEGGDGDGSGDSDGNGNGGDGNDNGNESGSDEPEAELQVFKNTSNLPPTGSISAGVRARVTPPSALPKRTPAMPISEKSTAGTKSITKTPLRTYPKSTQK